jgi:hypothetical protein
MVIGISHTTGLFGGIDLTFLTDVTISITFIIIIRIFRTWTEEIFTEINRISLITLIIKDLHLDIIIGGRIDQEIRILIKII